MVGTVKGKIINAGVSKKGNKYAQVLTPKPEKDGFDVIMVMAKRDYKVNQDVEIKCNAYVNMVFEL